MPKGIKGFQKGHKIFGGVKFKKGHKINLGKKHSDETKKKISEAHRGKRRSTATEFKNKNITRYDKAGGENKYRRLHIWVEKQLGKPKKCAMCGKDNLVGKHIHWANISGEYRKDVKDWIRLCVRCHYIMDNGKNIVSIKNKLSDYEY